MIKVLLYSGGMDSWLIDKLWNPDVCLYVNMQTQYGNVELEKQTAGKYQGIRHQIITLPLQRWEREDKIIPYRNLLLCIAAANEYQRDDVQICLGATAGDRVLDKSKKFAKMTTKLLSFLWQEQWWTKGRKVEVVVPYKDWTKEDLLRAYQKQGGDLEEVWKNSFSCYNPDEFGLECWECKPCVRKCLAFWAVGYRRMDDKVLWKVWNVFKKDIRPQILRGKYGRGKKEERELMRAWKEIGDKLHAEDKCRDCRCDCMTEHCECLK